MNIIGGFQRGFKGVAASFFRTRVDSEPHFGIGVCFRLRAAVRSSVPSLRSSTAFCLTFFDELHKHGVVAADGEPEAIFIFLDDHASLHQTCERDETKQGDTTEVFKRSGESLGEKQTK